MLEKGKAQASKMMKKQQTFHTAVKSPKSNSSNDFSNEQRAKENRKKLELMNEMMHDEPEDYLIEEMINLYRRRKQFDLENFLD